MGRELEPQAQPGDGGAQEWQAWWADSGRAFGRMRDSVLNVATLLGLVRLLVLAMGWERLEEGRWTLPQEPGCSENSWEGNHHPGIRGSARRYSAITSLVQGFDKCCFHGEHFAFTLEKGWRHPLHGNKADGAYIALAPVRGEHSW